MIKLEQLEREIEELERQLAAKRAAYQRALDELVARREAAFAKRRGEDET